MVPRHNGARVVFVLGNEGVVTKMTTLVVQTIPCTKYKHDCQCENCILERKQTGEWWLTEEGREEIRSICDNDPKAIAPVLLRRIEELEQEVHCLKKGC